MDNNINEVSRLASNSFQKGDFFSQQDLRVDGVMVGAICTTGRVVIGQGAYVKGEVVCSSLDVWGEIHGNIFVKDALSLKATAVVDGDLAFDRFQVEIGAVFSGACCRISEGEIEAKIKAYTPVDPREGETSDISKE